MQNPGCRQHAAIGTAASVRWPFVFGSTHPVRSGPHRRCRESDRPRRVVHRPHLCLCLPAARTQGLSTVSHGYPREEKQQKTAGLADRRTRGPGEAEAAGMVSHLLPPDGREELLPLAVRPQQPGQLSGSAAALGSEAERVCDQQQVAAHRRV